MKTFLLLGLLLTPFSTGVTSGYPVISFGLPFLLGALALSTILPGRSAFVLPRYVAPAVLSGAAVVLVMTLFTAVAPFPDRSVGRLMPNLIGFLLAFRLISLYRDDPEYLLKCALRLLVVSGAVMSAYYIVNLGLAISEYGLNAVMRARTVGGLASLPWGATNMISAALIFPHAACYLLRLRYKDRFVGPTLFLILFTVVLTLSRSGLLVHGALLVAACLFGGYYRFLLYGIVSVAVFVIGYAQVDPDSLSQLFDARLSTGGDLSNGRLESFRAKTAYVAENLMTPIGYYGSLFVFDGLTAHNFVLTLLVEQGALGFLCFVVFILSTVYAMARQRAVSEIDARCRRFLFTGGGLAFVNLMVEDANFSQPYIVYFWTFFLIVLAHSTILNRHAVRPERTFRFREVHG